MVPAAAIPDMPDIEEDASPAQLKEKVGQALAAMEARIIATAHSRFTDLELPPPLPAGDYDDDIIE